MRLIIMAYGQLRLIYRSFDDPNNPPLLILLCLLMFPTQVKRPFLFVLWVVEGPRDLSNWRISHSMNEVLLSGLTFLATYASIPFLQQNYI